MGPEQNLRLLLTHEWLHALPVFAEQDGEVVVLDVLRAGARGDPVRDTDEAMSSSLVEGVVISGPR